MIELDTTQPTPNHEITDLRLQLSGGISEHDIPGDPVYRPLFVERSSIIQTTGIRSIEAFKRELHICLDVIIFQMEERLKAHLGETHRDIPPNDGTTPNQINSTTTQQ